MQYAVFDHHGRRAHGFPLYATEADAMRASDGYREVYGHWVDVVCNDHPDHPRGECPEPHEEPS